MRFETKNYNRVSGFFVFFAHNDRGEAPGGAFVSEPLCPHPAFLYRYNQIAESHVMKETA